MVTSLTITWWSTPSMLSVFLEWTVDWDINFLPLDTSTKQTGLETGCMSFFTDLSLSGFEARVGFVDDVKPTASTDDFAVGVTILKCFDGRYNFHKGSVLL